MSTAKPSTAVDSTPRNTGLRAGVARRDITVEDPAVTVHDRLFAKALVLDDGHTRLAIVAIDAVAIGGICDISDEFMPELRVRAEKELGLTADQLLVSATHTHPPDPILCDHEQQIQRTLDAIREAADHLVPVRVGVGRGTENRIALNRNLNLTDGHHWTIRHTNPSPPDQIVESLNPIDPEIGVLRIDHADGRPFAVVFNYACHPLLGVPNQAVTANYPGFACRDLEAALGHGATALFLQGAAGDVIEVAFKDTHTPMHSEPVGAMLAQSTLAAWRQITTADAGLAVVCETVQLPRRTDSDRRIAELMEKQQALLDTLRYTSLNLKTFLPLYLEHQLNPSQPGDYKYRHLHQQQIGVADLADRDVFNRRNLEKYVDNLRVMEQLARIQDEIATYRRHQKINADSGEDSAEAHVMGLRIGDGVFVTAPIELLTDIGLGLKARSPHEFTFVAAFVNGYLHYGPPASYYDKGSYEVVECLLDPGWQKIYEDAADRVLQRL